MGPPYVVDSFIWGGGGGGKPLPFGGGGLPRLRVDSPSAYTRQSWVVCPSTADRGIGWRKAAHPYRFQRLKPYARDGLCTRRTPATHKDTCCSGALKKMGQIQSMCLWPNKPKLKKFCIIFTSGLFLRLCVIKNSDTCALCFAVGR